MKNLKLTAVGLGFLLLAISCNKKDHDLVRPVQQGAPSFIEASDDSMGWHSITQWQSIKQNRNSIFYFNITDKKFTSEVVSNGMVLVFKKRADSAVALPYEENKGNVSIYWYHQVSTGNLLILSDVHNTLDCPGAENSFKYIIVTPEQIKSLEEQGYTRTDILSLTYEQVIKVLDLHG